jgi:hypothetical protein
MLGVGAIAAHCADSRNGGLRLRQSARQLQAGGPAAYSAGLAWALAVGPAAFAAFFSTQRTDQIDPS